jgi:pyrimidine operon attenuation protein/uracil phosphoribosyltransferase
VEYVERLSVFGIGTRGIMIAKAMKTMATQLFKGYQ